MGREDGGVVCRKVTMQQREIHIQKWTADDLLEACSSCFHWYPLLRQNKVRNMPVQGEKSAFLTFIPTRKTHTVFPSSTAASLSQHVHGTTRTEQVYLTVIAVSNFSLCQLSNNCKTLHMLSGNTAPTLKCNVSLPRVRRVLQVGLTGLTYLYTQQRLTVKSCFPFFFLNLKRQRLLGY